jgi:putative (di)nucleoside polyphosphate hydrolase
LDDNYKNLPYRVGAIGIVFDKNDKVLIAQNNSYGSKEWSFPGGGRKPSESAEQNILRELSEELGVDASNLKIIVKSRFDVKYDFPEKMRVDKSPSALKYRGQKKEQFFVRFVGNKKNISINRTELRKYKWVSADDLKNYLIFRDGGQYEEAVQALNEYRKL